MKTEKCKMIRMLVLCAVFCCMLGVSAGAAARLNKKSADLWTGQSVQLSVVGTSKKVTWESNRPEVASVSANGLVTAKKAGTAIVRARRGDKSKKCRITVKQPSIALSRTEGVLYTSGKSQATLRVKVKGPSSSVQWKSNNPKVATVNSSGVVTAKSAGSAVIAAKANGVIAKCRIKVKKPSGDAALKAYADFLAKNESSFVPNTGDFQTKNPENEKKTAYFQIADLNRDGIPELITEHITGYKQADLYILTYKSGKVKNLPSFSGGRAMVNISTNAAGWYDIYVCSNQHLHANWNGGWLGYDDWAYTVRNGLFTPYAEANINTMGQQRVENYYLYSEKTTSNQYNAAINSCVPKVQLVQNNSANRNTYLK